MSAPVAAWFAIGAFGWVWGSFLNTVVDRTPRRNETGPILGWFSPPRSLCLACHAAIPWYDNLPVVSYVALRGRCRQCGTTIGVRTLIVELATPVLFVAFSAEGLTRLSWLAALWCAAALSVGIVGVPTLLEKRSLRCMTWALGVLGVIGVGVWLLG